jgi:dTDP-glucose pyrophosphorylase
MKILNFIEKPENPTSTLCSTLIYCLKNSTLKHIQTVIDAGKSDRAGDLIAYLCTVQDMHGYTIQ